MYHGQQSKEEKRSFRIVKEHETLMYVVPMFFLRVSLFFLAAVSVFFQRTLSNLLVKYFSTEQKQSSVGVL